MSRRPPGSFAESCLFALVGVTLWLGLVWVSASFGWRHNNSAAIWFAILVFIVPIIGILRERRRK